MEQYDDMDCTFCPIADGTAPSWRIYEDQVAVDSLDIGQATPGHTLEVPREHAADIWSLSEDDAAAIMVEAGYPSEPTTAGGSRPVSRAAVICLPPANQVRRLRDRYSLTVSWPVIDDAAAAPAGS